MCLIAVSWSYHPDTRLIMCANRDEFYSRPTKEAHFWEDNSDVLAGIDLKEGGSWNGIRKDGRFVAITNYRDFNNLKTKAPSRGLICRAFLNGAIGPADFLKKLDSRVDQYNSFNLLIGNYRQLYYYSSLQREILELKPGIYGLSNHLLDTPWPKVTKAKNMMAGYQPDQAPASILDQMMDIETAPDHLLPDTGIDKYLEKSLSSPFINMKEYGTRSGTFLTIDNRGKVQFTERNYTPKRTFTTSFFEFTIG